MSFEVRLAPEKDRDTWNRFVEREGGSFSQYYDWKEYYESGSKGRKYIPLVIEDDTAEWAGILPIVESCNGYYRTLNSLPEGSTNGFLTSSALTADERTEVIRTVLRFIDETYAETHAHLSLQEYVPPPYEIAGPSGILLEDGYRFEGNLATKLPGHHVLGLVQPFKENVFSGFAKNVRKGIRHARKMGAEVVIDEKFAYFDEIVAMHVELVKKFGLALAPDEFSPLPAIFRDRMKLFVCRVNDEPISGSLCFYTPTTAYWWMGTYKPAAENYLNNMLPTCSAIRDACESGYRMMDLGITLTPSLAFYKEKFGARCVPVMAYKKTFSPVKIAANKVISSLSGINRRLVRIP